MATIQSSGQSIPETLIPGVNWGAFTTLIFIAQNKTSSMTLTIGSGIVATQRGAVTKIPTSSWYIGEWVAPSPQGFGFTISDTTDQKQTVIITTLVVTGIVSLDQSMVSNPVIVTSSGNSTAAQVRISTQYQNDVVFGLVLQNILGSDGCNGSTNAFLNSGLPALVSTDWTGIGSGSPPGACAGSNTLNPTTGDVSGVYAEYGLFSGTLSGENVGFTLKSAVNWVLFADAFTASNGGNIPGASIPFQFQQSTVCLPVIGCFGIPVQLSNPAVLQVGLLSALAVVLSSAIGRQSWFELPFFAERKRRNQRRASLI